MIEEQAAILGGHLVWVAKHYALRQDSDLEELARLSCELLPARFARRFACGEAYETRTRQS